MEFPISYNREIRYVPNQKPLSKGMYLTKNIYAIWKYAVIQHYVCMHLSTYMQTHKRYMLYESTTWANML